MGWGRSRARPQRRIRFDLPIRALPIAALRLVAMDQALAAFRQFLTAEKRASEHTVRAYLHDLGEFREHAVATLGRAPALDELDVIMCRSYLASLHGKNDAVTIGRKLSSLRASFAWRCAAVSASRALCRRCALPSAPSDCRPSWVRRTSAVCSMVAGAPTVGTDAVGAPSSRAVRGHLRRRAAGLGGLQPRRRRRGERRRRRDGARAPGQGTQGPDRADRIKAQQATDAYLQRRVAGWRAHRPPIATRCS